MSSHAGLHQVTARYSRRAPGFTLAEMIITLLLFSIFSTAVAATIRATINFWDSSNSRILAMANVRITMQAITTEFRQSAMDGDSATGYASIGLTNPTPLLFPNDSNNVATTNTITCNTSSVPSTYTAPTSGCPLVFTEPNQANYSPTTASFNADSSANYQQVKFYVQANTQGSSSNPTPDEVFRVVTTYTGTGSSAAVNTVTSLMLCAASLSPGAANESGHITLTASNYTTTNANAVTVTVTATEDTSLFTLTTTVASLGQ